MNNIQFSEKDLLEKIKHYPLLCQCFSKYVNWILPNHQIIDLVEFDLMKILAPDDGKKLKRVEVLLTQSQEILGMDSTSFARVFGFTDDLLYSEIFVLVRENF